MIFRGNPKLARPGSEHLPNLHWIPFYKGHRLYNKQGNGRWIWNYDFRVTPGELYPEMVFPVDEKLIVIEPNVPNKPCAPNKQWPIDRWKALSSVLVSKGYKVRQFDYGALNRVADTFPTPTFMHAVALLKSARLAILHEGGLHHAAAAVGVPAVVIFGGFVPPAVLGYERHVNLTGGATACGSFTRCPHCIEAMSKIQVNDVLNAALWLLNAQVRK